MDKGVKWVVEDPKEKGVFWPSEELKKKAWVSDGSIYEEGAKDPVKFWCERAREGVDWFREWREDYKWEPPYYKWFIGGKLNVSYNAIDRHLTTWRRNKAAIIWEPEPVEEQARIITYHELYLSLIHI